MSWMVILENGKAYSIGGAPQFPDKAVSALTQADG